MEGVEVFEVLDWVLRCFDELQGINWVLEYYYRGVASWTWFYPHHFSPMISDMVNISEFRVVFEYGKPFLPFQQLLSVLPAASCKLLPAPYQVSSLAMPKKACISLRGI